MTTQCKVCGSEFDPVTVTLSGPVGGLGGPSVFCRDVCYEWACAEAGRIAVEFIESHCKHTKDPYSRQPFILAAWQRDDIIIPLFSKLRADGTRQYRYAYIEIARKNGKSELLAVILLYIMYGKSWDGKVLEGGEVYGAAGDRPQAALVFDVAGTMISMDPVMNERSKVLWSKKRATYLGRRNIYQAVSADANRNLGLNPSAVGFDEVLTQPNRKLWAAMTTGSGTREQPLTVAITTAGFDRETLCWELHEKARQITEGTLVDHTFFPYLRNLPEGADWTDESLWIIPNPALMVDSNPGGFRKYDELKEAFESAKSSLPEENFFRMYYLNQWVQSSVRAINMRDWNACDDPIDKELLAGLPCYMGLDLSLRWDLSAAVLCFDIDGKFTFIPYVWVPEDQISVMSKRDRVDYAMWVKQGLITATPGNVVDYAFVRRDINEICGIYDVREIAYDPWNATQLCIELGETDGLPVVEFRQGFKTMSGPTKDFLGEIVSHNIVHGGHAVFRWNADNLVVRTDPAGNLKPDKEKSTNKIDLMVGALMAYARATVAVETPSMWSNPEWKAWAARQGGGGETDAKTT